MSQEVTACQVTFKGKLGVANSQTPFYYNKLKHLKVNKISSKTVWPFVLISSKSLKLFLRFLNSYR